MKEGEKRLSFRKINVCLNFGNVGKIFGKINKAMEDKQRFECYDTFEYR